MANNKLRPIDELIKEIQKLSKDPDEYEDELKELRKQVIIQQAKINGIDSKKITKLINSGCISEKEENRYSELLKEKENYKKNKHMIGLIKKEDYDELYRLRIVKYKKFGVIAASSILVLSLTTCLVAKSKKAGNNIVEDGKYETMSEYTEENATSYITEATTELVTERVTEKVTEKPTEKQTERITEKPTEKKTEATTIATTKGTTEATEKKSETTTEKKEEIITEKKTEAVTEKKEEVTTEENKWKKYRDAEQLTIVNLFKDIKEEMSDLYHSKEAEIAKEKGKEYFKSGIDFIFFGSSINGITFSDLKDEFKEEIYETIKGVDEVIEYFEPDYKEKLGEKYNAVKDFSKVKLEQAKELIIKKIGQDKYDSIVNKKDEILDKIISTTKKYGGKALEYIKEKYINWRNKQD